MQIGLNFSVTPPNPLLAEYVKAFWILEGTAKEIHPFKHRALADVCPEFIFYLGGDFDRINRRGIVEMCFRSGVYGPKEFPEEFIARDYFRIFGATLYPHAVAELFAISTDEITNHCADLQSLCGRMANEIEQQIAIAPSYEAQKNILSKFILTRVGNVKRKPSTTFRHMIKNVIDNRGNHSVDEMVNACCLSRRQFERNFREYSGFSPKQFLNIARFGHTIKDNSIQRKQYAQLALDMGFADQPHFCREFKKYSGYSPADYFKNLLDTDYRATQD